MKNGQGEYQRFSYKKLLFGIGIVVIIFLINGEKVYASQQTNYSEKIDYSDIQEVIDEVLDQGDNISFQDYVEKLIAGKEPFSFSGIASNIKKGIKQEIGGNTNALGRLIFIGLIAAIFTNLSMAFKNNQVSETGFYITYLLLFGILIGSFISASTLAAAALSAVLDFMKALVPAYFLSVGFTTGTGTSMVFYEAALMLITLVDLLLIKFVIPLINIYLLIMLVNNLSKEDMLSKLASLLLTIINWLLKSLLAAVIGFHTIQGLIIPVVDRLKRSVFLKASEAIPGIGNALGSVTETVLGAGVLLKNAIGVAGLVIIIVICSVPLIKLLIITLIYKCGGAALQPISDKRILDCIGASAKSAGMLLQTVFVGAVLFLLTITIVAATTGN